MAKRETPTVEGRDQWLQVLRRLAGLADGEWVLRLSIRGRLPAWWTLEQAREEPQRDAPG